MNLIYVLLVIVIVGMIMYIINRYIPMAAGIKSVLNGVVILLLILWLLQVFGIIPAIVPINVR